MSRFDGNIVVGTSVDVGGIGTGLQKISNSFNKLARAVSNSPLVQLFSSAASAASDLVEVQNVVDVSFEDMAYKAELFSKNAIQQFGMSELAAKRTASSFMAMGKAADIGMENASNMAVNLAALTGDFASFYNISQEYARVALSAVYTGETETLKRYGIILTEANLQQYANTQGIEKNVKVMSAREKLILRYMYVMEKTKDMQGDFVRTQDSFANQTRLLSQAWTQFLIILGNGVTTVLSPVLKIIGQLIVKLQQFTQIVLSIIGNIFGLDLTRQTESIDGYTGAVEGAVEAEEDLEDAIKGSTKAAMKAIAPFDELNVLRTPSSSGKGGGDDIFGDFTAGMLYDWPSVTEEVFSSAIDNFYDFGRWLSRGFKDILDKIPWDDIFNVARTFGKNFADFLNGLFDPATFSSLGSSIANLFNTILYSIQEFANNFDWEQAGQAIASFINSLFTTFDWENASETINSVKDGLKKLFSTAVSQIEWGDIADEISDFLANLDWEVKLAAVATVIAAALSVLLTKAIFPMLTMVFGKVGSKIAEGIFTMLFGESATALTILGRLAEILAGISGVVLMIVGGIMTIVSWVQMMIDKFTWVREIIMLVGIALAAIGAIILVIAGIVDWPIGAILAIAAGLAVVLTGIVLIKDAIVANWETIKEFFANVWSYIQVYISYVQALVEIVVRFIVDLVSTIVERVVSIVQTIYYYISKYIEAWAILIKAGIKVWVDALKFVFDFLVSFFTPMINFWKNVFETTKALFVAFFNDFIKPHIDNYVSEFTKRWELIKTVFTGIIDFIKTTVVPSIEKLFKGLAEGVVKFIVQGINLAIGAIEDYINKVMDLINAFIKGLNFLVSGAAKYTNTNWEDIKLLDKVTLSRIPIPKLAQGAVIPPNAPFMAMLGDQKNGTNIEAPLDTIKQALQEALASSGFGANNDIVIPISIDGREIARAVVKQNDIYKRSTGRSLI